MLQRAASNAYSWWWASHIRTKQSKWLEQSLQDMEEKVANAMNLIQKDGDSFAKRAEMYYKHRPELIAFIEESVRAYRALAERYDKLSTDLQKANTTIASVFPDQLPYDTDYEDDNDNDNDNKRFNMPKNIPKAPKVPEIMKTLLTNDPKKSIVKTDKGFLKSGLTKEEAVQEIDKLQKEILSMQTMKEFTKSSYESGLAKSSEIEKKIVEMQERVSDLQDEFKVVKSIEDDDARAIMAEAALKSCEESLAMLQARHENSSQEARLEHEKIQNVKQKLESFKHEYLQFKDNDEKYSTSINEREQQETLSKKPLTVTEMADMIDKLVNKVISLETLVSSQSALMDTLKIETNDVIQKLEEAKANSVRVANNLEKKLDENQNNSLKIEADCNVTHLFDNIYDEDFKLSESSMNDGQIKLTAEFEAGEIRNDDRDFNNDDALRSKKPEEEEMNLQQLLLSGLDDKEKVLLQEYTKILRKYKTAKKELVDEEHKNQETVTELQDLKTMLAIRDNEIQQMKQKLKLVQDVEVTNEKSVFIDKSEIEAKLRTDIDAILEENIDFWLRFSSTFHQVQKFKTQVEDLQQEIIKVKAKRSDGIRSEMNAIFKHLKEIQTELAIWLEQSVLLKKELQRRFSSLYNIQEEIKRALREGVEAEEIKFNTLQAAKLQGEVSNMQQENTKVNQELEAALNHVTALQLETEETLKMLKDEFSLSDHKSPHVPLRSFIFGVKSKKQKPSILACINPHKKLIASHTRIM